MHPVRREIAIFGLKVLLGLALGSASMATAATDFSKCEDAAVVIQRMNTEKQVVVVKANRVEYDPDRLQAWNTSLHQYGGSKLNGIELDEILDSNRDPEVLDKIDARMAAQGVSAGEMAKGRSEMLEYVELTSRQKLRQTYGEFNEIILSGGTASPVGYLMLGNKQGGDRPTKFCTLAVFGKVFPQNFSRRTMPDWLGNYRGVGNLVAYYQRSYGYGIMAVGVSKDLTQVTVLMGRQQPSDLRLNGVIITGTTKKDDRARIHSDLVATQYGIDPSGF